jgi:SOS-response transcriptional repressor LexA
MRAMKTLGQVVRDRRKALHLTLEDVANQIPGYDAANLSRFERGLNSIQIEKLDQLAAALHIRPADLYSQRDVENGVVLDPSFHRTQYNVVPTVLNGRRLPVISNVQAGMWTGIADNFHPGDAEDWVTPEEPMSRRAFALRVSGDSMLNPAGLPTFPEGIIIMVEPDLEAKAGDFVVVRCNGDEEATFKKLTRESGAFLLTPLNPRYPVVPLPPDAVICGVVREAQFRLR